MNGERSIKGIFVTLSIILFSFALHARADSGCVALLKVNLLFDDGRIQVYYDAKSKMELFNGQVVVIGDVENPKATARIVSIGRGYFLGKLIDRKEFFNEGDPVCVTSRKSEISEEDIPEKEVKENTKSDSGGQEGNKKGKRPKKGEEGADAKDSDKCLPKTEIGYDFSGDYTHWVIEE